MRKSEEISAKGAAGSEMGSLAGKAADGAAEFSTGGDAGGKARKRGALTVMARLIVLVRPLIGYMALAIGMGLVGNLCATFLTVFGGVAILDVLQADGESPLLSLPLAGIFAGVCAMALLRAVLRYAEQGCNHFIAFQLLAIIRDKVFRALRKLCPAKLEGRDRGDLISVITSDIELLEVFYAHTISPIAIAILFDGILCLFIGSFHWALGLLALAAYVTVGIVLPLVISRLGGDVAKRFRDGSGALSAFVLESLRGLSETMQYGQGQAREAEMIARADALSGDEWGMKRNAGLDQAVSGAVILLFDLAMLFASMRLCQTGQISSFDGVVLPTLALFASFGPSAALASLGSTLQNTIAAGNRVLDILDDTPEVVEVEGRPSVSFSGASVEHVTFSYGKPSKGQPGRSRNSQGHPAFGQDSSGYVLSDVSIDIPQGKVIGIVGRSGSGKSTLLKLLMRFWDVREGAVKVSGVNVSDINTANLRDMEGFVEQETHLFHDSVRNNVRIAKLDATDEEIEEACRKASVHDFIQTLPQGYDTPVGELGDTLSGGERQRLGLARAFLHDAPMMLLDEPTSNLDSLNEAVILKSLDEGRKDKTVVLVSHRKSTMRIADKVYSVESGRVS